MNIEKYVNDLTSNFTDAEHLTIENVSQELDLNVIQAAPVNVAVKLHEQLFVYIKQDSPFNMWQSFCHELGHCLLHRTNQLQSSDLFNQKQEAEVERFSILFMMPEKIIIRHRLWDYTKIATYFKVPQELALKRIEMLKEQYHYRFYGYAN